MNGIKVIFFDAYGTFLSTGTGSVDAARNILIKNGRDDIDPAAFYARWKQLHRQAMRRGEFLAERDIFATDLAGLYREYDIDADPSEDVCIMLRSLLDRKVFPETARVMETLRGRYRLMVASNTDTEPLMQNLRVNRLGFDAVFTSEMLGCYKPAPQFYERILAQADVCPEEAVFVGDSPEEDVIAPSRAGMRTVLVDRRGCDLQVAAEHTIADLCGLINILE